MSQLLLKILDLLGRAKFQLLPKDFYSEGRRGDSGIAAQDGTDAEGGDGWRRFLEPKSLFDVWGPTVGSPWEYYHTVPLFAAMEASSSAILIRGDVAPLPSEYVRAVEEDSRILSDSTVGEKWGEGWLTERMMIILDLPGVMSVAAAVRFVRSGFQPVCTFDNWPHPEGVLKPQLVLAQLLRYATTMESVRVGVSESAPPVLVTDSLRLGKRMPGVGDFDNRYYLDDSILPSIEVLNKNGIKGIVCLLKTDSSIPTADICYYFRGLMRAGFRSLYRSDISDPKLAARPFTEAELSTPFDQRNFQFSKSAAGGFGRLVPEPSSGGG
jgi:hypothetical protein